MIDSTTELKVAIAANRTTVDDATTGGGVSSPRVYVTGAIAGELLTRLRAKPSGTIDDSDAIEKQYQKGFWENLNSTSDLLNGIMWILNGEKRPASPGTARFVTTANENTGEGGAVKGHVWGINHSTGLIDEEDVLFSNTPGENAGTKTFDFIIRRQIQYQSDGSQAALTGDCGLKVGTEATGVIPAPYSWASEEFQAWGVATTGDSGTTTNRKTAPSGSTFTRAYSLATGIYVRNDSGNATLGHGEVWGFWVQQILQPGMPPTPPTLQLVLWLQGDST